MRRLAGLVMVVGMAGCSSAGGPDAALTTASVAPPAAIATPNPQPEAQPAEREAAAGQTRIHAEAARDVTLDEALAFKPEEPVVVATAAAFAAQTVRSPRFTDAKPIAFGRVKPAHYEVHGVDVSRWQGDIDWVRLRRQGANFAYIKATDGTDHADPRFLRNWRGAAAAGIPRGAYHFFYWCSPASAQADWFIRNVPKEKGALPPVIDVEWNHQSRSCKTRPSRARVLEKMKVFIDRLEAHYGQKPVIYTAPDFYEDNLEGAFTDYPFWLRSVADHPKNVYPGRDFAFWQYSGTGLASGVDNHIDLNAFNGTAEGWRNWLGSRVR